MDRPEQHRNAQPSGHRSYNNDEFISFNETVRRMFENLFHGLEQQYRQLGIGLGGSSMNVLPYQYNFGSSVGQIVNDAERFVMEIDVSHFHPTDLKVNLRHGELSVEGHQKQQRDRHGSIERHFVRRFTLPDDVDETTLASQLKDNGMLEISARKRNVAPVTPTRNIPIQTYHVDQQRSQPTKRDDSTGSRTGKTSNP